MIHRYLLITGMLSLQMVAAQASEQRLSNTNTSCYSSYHFTQKMDLSVNFGSSIQQQKTQVDMDIHVREIAVSDNTRSQFRNESRPDDIRSFVMLVNSNLSKVNGVEVDMSERFRHPFLVFLDNDSGKLLDLKSTVEDLEIRQQYLSFFDLFQYSEHSGEYRYRNSNGWYQAKISQTAKNPARLIRENTGYLETDEDNNRTQQLKQSILSITMDDTQSECFYRKAEGEEAFNRVLTAKAFVKGDARITIEADLTRTLPAQHFFYTLTDELTTWPVFDNMQTVSITQEQAFSKLPILLTELSSLILDRSQFIQAMLADREVWPFLSNYILTHSLSDELSVKLFWSLDRIDTTESVNALAKLVTSPLSDRDLFRAMMALGSTSASFDQASVELLKNHMATISSTGFTRSDDITFIRMLGAMVDNRNTTDPHQSNELKHFLYDQAGAYDETVNAAVIDAIGNLKGSIDVEGEEILLQGLSEESDNIRLAAISAFKRVPYKAENSYVFIDQLNNENNINIKSRLIEVMGRTNNSDYEVKQQLLSLVNNSTSPKLKNKSLGSLKKINYAFEDNDIQILESELRQETDKASQRLLAALILKHRRQQ